MGSERRMGGFRSKFERGSVVRKSSARSVSPLPGLVLSCLVEPGLVEPSSLTIPQIVTVRVSAQAVVRAKNERSQLAERRSESVARPAGRDGAPTARKGFSPPE